MASPVTDKASGSKKKGEKKFAVKEEYRLLSSIMGMMNNLRKQVSWRHQFLLPIIIARVSSGCFSEALLSDVCGGVGGGFGQ